MNDPDREQGSIGIRKGLAITVVMILAFAVISDARFTTTGIYVNSLNSAQRLEFKTGSYFSGTARLRCYKTALPVWVAGDDEMLEYSRNGKEITLNGSKGSATFEIYNQKLIGPTGEVWTRVYPGD